MKMKLNPNSTRPQIFDGGYEHPWYEHATNKLIKPNPPTQQAVEKAKFVDKTYKWSGGDNIRPRNKRAAK